MFSLHTGLFTFDYHIYSIKPYAKCFKKLYFAKIHASQSDHLQVDIDMKYIAKKINEFLKLWLEAN